LAATDWYWEQDKGRPVHPRVGPGVLERARDPLVTAPCGREAEDGWNSSSSAPSAGPHRGTHTPFLDVQLDHVSNKGVKRSYRVSRHATFGCGLQLIGYRGFWGVEIPNFFFSNVRRVLSSTDSIVGANRQNLTAEMAAPAVSAALQGGPREAVMCGEGVLLTVVR
jgi:hypothetical protein